MKNECAIVYHGHPRDDRSVIEFRTGWLCKQLRLLENEAPSLIHPDLMKWWNDHKAEHEDLDRRIALDAQRKEEKDAALAKLSLKERKLLNVK